ncbi:MAG: hypothetical protein R2694_09635 [Ilumatobacteraceae bacterium]
MFGRTWERLDGTVVAAALHADRQTSEGVRYTRMKYVVEYRLPGGDPVRVELKDEEKFGNRVMTQLAEGATAPLLVDPKSGKVRFDADDPRINLKARREVRKREEGDAFKRALGD